MNLTAIWTAGMRLAIGALNNPTSSRAGSAATERYALAGVIFSGNGLRGNPAPGSLAAYTRSIEANMLNADGCRLRVTACGALANNANAKRIVTVMGATNPFDTGSITTANAQWFLEQLIERTSSSTYRCINEFSVTVSGVTTLVKTQTSGSLDWTSVNTLYQSITGVGASDVTVTQYLVELLPAIAATT